MKVAGRNWEKWENAKWEDKASEWLGARRWTVYWNGRCWDWEPEDDDDDEEEEEEGEKKTTWPKKSELHNLLIMEHTMIINRAAPCCHRGESLFQRSFSSAILYYKE